MKRKRERERGKNLEWKIGRCTERKGNAEVQKRFGKKETEEGDHKGEEKREDMRE